MSKKVLNFNTTEPAIKLLVPFKGLDWEVEFLPITAKERNKLTSFFLTGDKAEIGDYVYNFFIDKIVEVRSEEVELQIDGNPVDWKDKERIRVALDNELVFGSDFLVAVRDAYEARRGESLGKSEAPTENG